MNDEAGPLGTVGRALGLRSSESRAMGSLLTQAFLLGVAVIASYSIANAHFLAVWAPSDAPWTYVAAGIGILVAGAAFRRADRATGLRRTAVATLVVLAVLVAAQWIGLRLRPADPALCFVGPVWFRLLWVLGNLALWSQVDALVDVRQSKRLFPLVTLTSVLGILAYGLLNEVLVAVVGTVDLLAVVAVAISGAALAALLLPAAPRHPPDARSARVSPLAPAARRFVAWVFAYTVFATAGSYVLDYAFLTVAQARYTAPDDLAVFFGRYLGAMTLAVLVVTAAGSVRVLQRFGVRTGLAMNPTIVGLGTASAIAAVVFQAPDLLLFALIVGTRGANETATPTFTQPSVRLLLQALPTALQARALAWNEGLVAPLTTALAGGALLLALWFGGTGTLLALSLLAAVWVGWGACTVAVGVVYPAMAQRSLATSALRAARRTLPSAPRAPLDALPAEAARLALRVGVHRDAPDPIEALAHGLRHLEADVRIASASALRELGTGARGVLMVALQQERLPEVRGAMLGALAAVAEGGADATLLPALDGPAVEADAALGALLAHGGPRGLRRALDRLGSLPPDQEGRLRLARVLETAGQPRFAPLVRDLLDDPTPEVRRAALRALGGCGCTSLVPALLPALKHPAEARPLLAALRRIGAPAVSALAPALNAADLPTWVQARVVRIAGELGGPEAVRLAVRAAGRSALRNAALRVLARLDYQAEPTSPVAALLDLESDCAVALVKLGRAAGDDLADVVHRARRASLGRTLALLGCMGHRQAARAAAAGLGSRRPAGEALGLEVLDASLPRTVKRWVVPLAEAVLRPRPASVADPQAVRRLAEIDLGSSLLRAVATARLREPVDVHDADVRAWLGEETAMLRPWEKALALNRNPAFAVLDDDVLAGVAALADTRTVVPDERIVRVGDASGPVYLVVSGSVRVEYEGRVLATLGAGAVFGELDVFDPGPRAADVIAIEGGTLLVIDGQVLRDLLVEHPALALGFLQSLTITLREQR